MKKSELRQIIREEIKTLTEGQYIVHWISGSQADSEMVTAPNPAAARKMVEKKIQGWRGARIERIVDAMTQKEVG
jgi:hypothetical protein